MSYRALTFEWLDRAECRNTDPSRWGRDLEYSRAFCARCPVIAQCLADTLVIRSPEYAAGMTAATRLALGPVGVAREVAALVPDALARETLTAALTVIATTPGKLIEHNGAGVPVAPRPAPAKPVRSWKREAVAAEWRRRLAENIWLGPDRSKPLGQCTARDLWEAATLHRAHADTLDRLADIVHGEGARTVAHLDIEALAFALGADDNLQAALAPGTGRDTETAPRGGGTEDPGRRADTAVTS